ncbi:MAG: 30S ribosomal protein S8e [Parcubacteria group bacterium GW2011_GWA2_31_28]|nr:MAG: 30S ribosomal protein S8e [Parcubacteria group bacterium GW2011_GWA2_31_28]
MNKGRKISGGKYHSFRKTKLFERPGQDRATTLGETKRKPLRVRGGNIKPILLRAEYANVVVKGKAQKAEIVNVEETPQNRFFARQNVLLKGAIIATSLGKAKITNRPSQEGCVNAVLLEEKK